MDPRATFRPIESESIYDDGGAGKARICIFSKTDFDDQLGWRTINQGPKLILVRREQKLRSESHHNDFTIIGKVKGDTKF